MRFNAGLAIYWGALTLRFTHIAFLAITDPGPLDWSDSFTQVFLATCASAVIVGVLALFVSPELRPRLLILGISPLLFLNFVLFIAVAFSPIDLLVALLLVIGAANSRGPAPASSAR